MREALAGVAAGDGGRGADGEGVTVKEPVDHILRPQLPWRIGPGITECGYSAEKVPTLTRAAYFERLKDMGQQRCAMVTCMTCSDTARRWATWDEEPRHAMQREIEWEAGGGYRFRRGDERGVRLRDELLAVAALIEAHREEFDAHIAATEQRRAWLEQKAAHAAKPKPKQQIFGLDAPPL